MAFPGQAITIDLIDLGGTEPEIKQGTGTLTGLMLAARDYWEAAYPGDSDFTLTLRYEWKELKSTVLASHDLQAGGGTPHRETAGIISFNNIRTDFFIDPTPSDHSEFQTYTESSSDLGGVTMNTMRRYTDPTGDAVGHYDLFTTVLHEMGHSLGLAVRNSAFRSDMWDWDIDVESPRPFAGASIPLYGQSPHIWGDPTVWGDLSGTLMYVFPATDERKLPTHADIVANAEISEFNDINLNPFPEPSTLGVLVVSGALSLRRHRGQKC